jgi:transposase
VSTIDSGHYGDGVARRTKRLWTDEEKRSICFQTTAPGVSVAQVARRYAVNANLIFKWLRDPRYAPDPALVAPPSEEARFLPVEIVAQTRSVPAAPAAENHIEIELAGGHRMRISGSYDPEALARLIRGSRCDPGPGQYAGLAGGRGDGHAQGICGTGPHRPRRCWSRTRSPGISSCSGASG